MTTRESLLDDRDGARPECLWADFPGDACQWWNDRYGHLMCSVCVEESER